MEEELVLTPFHPPLTKQKNKKPKEPKEPKEPIEKNKTIFTYQEYFKENIELKLTKYKLIELKEISKYNKIKIGKNKIDMIKKINKFYKDTIYAIKLQKWCRGFFVRLFFTYFKKNKSSIKNCVNENDFYTLEPLKDIDFKELFITTDEDGFIYGFNVNSLITMYKKSTWLSPKKKEPMLIMRLKSANCKA